LVHLARDPEPLRDHPMPGLLFRAPAPQLCDLSGEDRHRQPGHEDGEHPHRLPGFGPADRDGQRRSAGQGQGPAGPAAGADVGDERETGADVDRPG
jgi:hypothetical protein